MYNFWLYRWSLLLVLFTSSQVIADIICEQDQMNLRVIGNSQGGYQQAAFTKGTDAPLPLMLTKVSELKPCRPLGNDAVYYAKSQNGQEFGALILFVDEDWCTRTNGCREGKVKATLAIDPATYEFTHCRKINN